MVAKSEGSKPLQQEQASEQLPKELKTITDPNDSFPFNQC